MFNKMWQQFKKGSKVNQTIKLSGVFIVILFILQVTPPFEYYQLQGILTVGGLTVFVGGMWYLDYLGKSSMAGLLLCVIPSLLIGGSYFFNISLGVIDTSLWTLLFFMPVMTWLSGWLLNQKSMITSIAYNILIVSLSNLLYLYNNIALDIKMAHLIILLSQSAAVYFEHQNREKSQQLLQQAQEKNRIIEEKLHAEQQAREAEHRENLALQERNKLLEEKLYLIQQTQAEAEAKATAEKEKRQAIEAKLAAQQEKRQAIEAELKAKKETERYNTSLDITLKKHASLEQENQQLKQQNQKYKTFIQTLGATQINRAVIQGQIVKKIQTANGKKYFQVFFEKFMNGGLSKKKHYFNIISSIKLFTEVNIRPGSQILVSGLLESQRKGRPVENVVTIIADTILLVAP